MKLLTLCVFMVLVGCVIGQTLESITENPIISTNAVISPIQEITPTPSPDSTLDTLAHRERPEEPMAVGLVIGRSGEDANFAADRVGIGIGETAAPGGKLEVNGGAVTLTNAYLDINRDGSTRGGINWYSQAYTSWSTYMSPPGAAGSGPSGTLTPPSGSYVTSWALRNFIENNTGYGWTFESGTAYQTNPTVKFEIRSSDGTYHSYGSGIIDAGITIGNGVINSNTDHLEFMSGVRADDNSYEWIGFYSGSTRQGIFLYDGAWSGANSRTDEFSLTAENNNLLTLNTNNNHVALMPKGAGNVGVKTLAPGYTLDVNGTANASLYRLANNFQLQQGGSDYGQFSSWVHLNGYYGLYSGNNSAHFYPNNSTYGAWKISGTRNGYGGINYNGRTVLMMQDDLIGLYNEAYSRWIIYGYGSDGSTYIAPNGGSINTAANFYINNTSPTLYLQDTDNRSSMIHCNSNIFYVLRGSGTNSTVWETYGGYWPLTINLENNDASFGGFVYGRNTSGYYGYLGYSSYGVYGYGYYGGYFYSDYNALYASSPANGSGRYSSYGYRSSSGDGSGYHIGSASGGVGGYAYWGNLYAFGVAGTSFGDYTRTGGVQGYCGGQWGSLGYKNSGSTYYGLYYTNAGAGGGRRRPGSSIDGEAHFNIGAGGYGDLFGFHSEGEIYGSYIVGGRYASYDKGDRYITGVDVHLTEVGGENRAVSFTNTSAEATITADGTSNLSNGTARVVFNETFRLITDSDKPITVTSTPLGPSNGIYISEISADGFTVVENAGGRSNVPFTWIAIARRIDAKSIEQLPREVIASDYDDKISRGLHNDSDTQTDGEGLYYQRGELTVGKHPSVLPDPQLIALKEDFEKNIDSRSYGNWVSAFAALGKELPMNREQFDNHLNQKIEETNRLSKKSQPIPAPDPNLRTLEKLSLTNVKSDESAPSQDSDASSRLKVSVPSKNR